MSTKPALSSLAACIAALALCAAACNNTTPARPREAGVNEAGSDGASGDGAPGTTPRIVINGQTKTTHGHATTLATKAVSFTAEHSCPAGQSCSYRWDLGNGSKASGKAPAAVTYSSNGIYRVKLTVTGEGTAELGTAAATVTAWGGKMTDAFARSSIGWDANLWLKPLKAGAVASISSGWLQLKHDLGLPGSGAVVASPLLKDAHLEVTIRRAQDTTAKHYSYVLLRVGPTKRDGSYYALQILEDTPANANELALSIIKVTDPLDQGGQAISSSPAIMQLYDKERKKDFRVIADIKDDPAGVPTFNVSVVDATNTSKVLVRLNNVKDSGGSPLAAGFFGLSHDKGLTLFDNFSLEPSTMTQLDGGVPDLAAPDGGVEAGPSPEAGAEAGPGDAAAPDIGPLPTPQLMINNDPTSTHGYATVKVGGALTFTGVMSCPAAVGCSYAWNFGNGKTATGKTPAAVTYAKAGQHHVTFTVRDKSNAVVGTAKGLVTAWSGKHSDSFTRAAVDWDTHLWLKPISSAVSFSIKSNWLYTSNTLGLPGSGAIRSSPLVKDVHVEVTIKRSTLTTAIHYTDVILRMHPSKLNGSFYRVRVKEGVAAYNNEVDLTIFKIISSADEHGISLTKTPPILAGYDAARKQDILLKVDLKDDKSGVPVFNVTMASAAAPTKVLLQLKDVKDSTTTPHSYAGFTGLTQFKGETYYDNFVVQQLAP